MCIESSDYTNSIIDLTDKYQFLHKRSEELYDYKGSMALKEAMKRHLYKAKFRDEAIYGTPEPIDNYNPRTIYFL